MPRFCVECGKNIETGKVCDDCKDLFLDFKPINIKLCPSKKIFYKNKWKPYKDLDQALKKIIEESLNKQITLEESLEKNILEKTGLKKDLPVTIIIEGEYYAIPLGVEVTYSPDKAKEGSEYYEGVLQLRNADMEAKDFVKNHINKSDFFVNKLIDKGDKVDFYITSKKEQVKIAKKLINHYGAYVESNANLFSKDWLTSKEIHRVNTLAVIPLFKEGDVIIHGGKPILVKKRGSSIKGFDLENNKKVNLNLSKEDYDTKPLEVKQIQITQTKPLLKGLSDEDYQEINLHNPLNKKIKINDKVKAVSYKNSVYVI